VEWIYPSACQSSCASDIDNNDVCQYTAQYAMVQYCTLGCCSALRDSDEKRREEECRGDPVGSPHGSTRLH
jgi:hypothetical protein